MHCEEACQLAGVDYPGCCPSCHEDAEKFGLNMTTVQLKGQNYQVCCDVANSIEKHQKSGKSR
jgi:hypothetical protein